MKKAKSNYYQECINNNKGNSAGLWKTLNEITSRDNKSGSVPTAISSDKVLYNKPQLVTNILNNYLQLYLIITYNYYYKCLWYQRLRSVYAEGLKMCNVQGI